MMLFCLNAETERRIADFYGIEFDSTMLRSPGRLIFFLTLIERTTNRVIISPAAPCNHECGRFFWLLLFWSMDMYCPMKHFFLSMRLTNNLLFTFILFLSIRCVFIGLYSFSFAFYYWLRLFLVRIFIFVLPKFHGISCFNFLLWQ